MSHVVKAHPLEVRCEYGFWLWLKFDVLLYVFYHVGKLVISDMSTIKYPTSI